MGRPPKPRAEKLSECVMVRLAPADRKRLEADAKRAGLPLATYLLQCWREGRG